MVLLPLYARFALRDKLFKRVSRRPLLTGAFCTVLTIYIALFFYAVTPQIPSEEQPLLVYSNQKRDDIKLLLGSALKQAHSDLYINVYGITDPEIIGILNHKSAHGISTKVTYDKRASLHLCKQLEKTITAYPIEGSGLMHRKIIIIDDKIIFLGSANLTSTSLQHHDNSVVGIYSPPLAAYLKEHQSPPKKRRISKYHPRRAYPPFHTTIGNIPLTLWLLPDVEKKIENTLITLLSSAKKTIHIAMFTLTHPTLTQALVAAKKRGVEVDVALDYYTAKGASFKMMQLLRSQGVTLHLSRGQQLLHHKWALIDGTSLLLGSANWTKAAFEKNEDFILYLPTLPPYFAHFMQTLWSGIRKEAFYSDLK